MLQQEQHQQLEQQKKKWSNKTKYMVINGS